VLFFPPALYEQYVTVTQALVAGSETIQGLAHLINYPWPIFVYGLAAWMAVSVPIGVVVLNTILWVASAAP
jgi:hypothetical protein